MDWDALKQVEPKLVQWLDKFAAMTLASESKRMVEEVREIFKDKNMNTSALVLKYHRMEELVMRCVHHLTREGRLFELNEALNELPDQIFASCMPNLSYVELTYHFPTTLYMCSCLINRFYRIKQRHKLPICVIDTLLYQLCLWLFKSTLQEQDYSHYITEIKECLRAIEQLEPNLMERVMRNRREINLILDSLATHPFRSTLIEDTIKNRVQGRLVLLNTVSNKLEMLSEREIISIGQMLHEGQRPALNIEDFDSFVDPPLTYTQLEERISLSIELLAAVRPVQREDDLASLADKLEKRIESDKSTVALIDKLSTHSFDTMLQDEPIDTILIRYLHGIEMLLSITDTDGVYRHASNDLDSKEPGCLVFPKLEPHTEAFHSVAQSEIGTIQSNPYPVTSSTPVVYKPYPTLPSTDEIRVVHTPETLVATLVLAVPNSPTVLDKDTSQQAEAEITRLKNRILILEGKLSRSKRNLLEMQQRDKTLQKRVSVLTKKQVLQESYLEEIYLPQYRRSEVIQRFSDLYLQERLDCLEKLRFHGLSTELSTNILFSIHKIAYELTQLEDRKITQKLKILLHISNNPLNSLAIQESVYAYLRKENVILPKLIPVLTNSTLCAVSCEYGGLVDISDSKFLRDFTGNCVELAWSILIQTPKLFMDYTNTKFDAISHRRLFSSNEKSDKIRFYAWPSLLETDTQQIVCQGVVVT